MRLAHFNPRVPPGLAARRCLAALPDASRVQRALSPAEVLLAIERFQALAKARPCEAVVFAMALEGLLDDKGTPGAGPN
jgi:hypothetical protein